MTQGPRTAVIVQARMGSSRLPGKVLEPLAGETVLGHVLRRCRAVEGADVVVCAMPVHAANDALVDIVQAHGATVFRGPESDVLGRYLGAARQVEADVILRVTSDCPLIDPDVCGRVLALRAAQAADYACNNAPPTFPHGLDCEAFTRAALETANQCAQTPHEREHVTPWLRGAPSVSRANLHGPGGALVEERWTLDYPEDLAFLRAVFALLPEPPALPGMTEVLALLDRRPELRRINALRRDPARVAASKERAIG